MGVGSYLGARWKGFFSIADQSEWYNRRKYDRGSWLRGVEKEWGCVAAV